MELGRLHAHSIDCHLEQYNSLSLHLCINILIFEKSSVGVCSYYKDRTIIDMSLGGYEWNIAPDYKGTIVTRDGIKTPKQSVRQRIAIK